MSQFVVYLIVHVLLFPDMPGIVAGVFETEAQCSEYAQQLDASTRLQLRMTCEVWT